MLSRIKPKKDNQHKIFILLGSIILLGGYLAYFGYHLTTKPDFSSEQQLTINKGEGATEIAERLKREGWVSSAHVFEWYSYLTGKRGQVKAGVYLLPPLTIPNLASVLAAGAGPQEQSIKIIEGWTLKEIGAYLEKEGVVAQANEFLAKVGQPAYCDGRECLKQKISEPEYLTALTKQYSFFSGLPKTATLEGYLFPDTYRIFKNGSLDEIIKKLLDNFDQKLEPFMRYEIETQDKNIYQILTMASIIEAEVPHEADRAIISGILWKRLDAGMPLQVDSTLNYVTGHGSRALSSAELKIDSPYNTYLYPDLSPGPIGNPGLSAIKAAIYPQDSPYWFFLSTKDGETIFSKTLDEHNQAKQQYLK